MEMNKTTERHLKNNDNNLAVVLVTLVAMVTIYN